MDETYPLPSNGWRPGMFSHTALRTGRFHAVMTQTGVEAWLGEDQEEMTWPDGWRAGFNPTRLIDPSGSVFAVEGDLLDCGGGLDSHDRWAVTRISHPSLEDRRR